MKHFKSNKRLNETGLSLLEVVASIVLLTIILLSVASMLIQSSKTTSTSEDIIDATYIAQREMEDLYNYAKKNEFNLDKQTTYQSKSWNYSKNPTDNNNFENNEIEPYITISFNKVPLYSKSNNIDSNLTRVIIKVYDKKSDKKSGKAPKAQVENTLEWRS